MANDRPPLTGRFQWARRVEAAAKSVRTIDFLALHGGISRRKLKELMQKGAVWRSPARPGGKRTRLRRATLALDVGDLIELFHDAAVLAASPPKPVRLALEGDSDLPYSLWYKPPRLLTQGTNYGDHCALLRLVELDRQQEGQHVFLVHRLDHEASGLTLIAHTARAAAELSRLFREGRIQKTYLAEAIGDVTAAFDSWFAIETPLGGKACCTRYRRIEARGPSTDTTFLVLQIETGRKHQIRRHLASIHHPVVGDRRYGKQSFGRMDLALIAYGLSFRCPLSSRQIDVRLGSAQLAQSKWTGPIPELLPAT
jgi:tRNA pseudouridine32 synthase/23S rRNA pseudouridine746 synthase